jgi:SAM-dependent methyltransferase
MRMITDPLAEARRIWSLGDYPAVAQRIAAVGREVVAAVDIGPRDRVLDVACGAGNATLPAARIAKEVVGLDLTPSLLEAGRRAAAREGLPVRWVEGDAQDPPFPDGAFDVAISTFGSMFPPDQARTAAQMIRVLRPGGRMGVCSWTPEGSVGLLFGLIARHAPAGPGPSPLAWGSEEGVRRLLGGLDHLRTARRVVRLLFSSVDEAVTVYCAEFGPILAMRPALEAAGTWTGFRRELLDLLAGVGTDGPSGYEWPAEYLLVTGRRPGADHGR